MASLNCTFVGPTDLHNHLPNFIPAEITSLLATVTDFNMSETIRDFTLNTTFRRDVFIKKSNVQTAEKIQNQLDAIPIVLARSIEYISYDIDGALPFQLDKALYGPTLAFLTENDYAPKTIKQICEHAKSISIPREDCIQMLRLLLSFLFILPYQEPCENTKKNCKNLNAYFCKKARKGQYSTILVSPMLGNGMQVSRMDQLFLDAQNQGKTTAKECAEYVYVILKKNGESINDLSKDLNTQEALRYLERASKFFTQIHLPWLRRMGI